MTCFYEYTASNQDFGSKHKDWFGVKNCSGRAEDSKDSFWKKEREFTKLIDATRFQQQHTRLDGTAMKPQYQMMSAINYGLKLHK